MAVFKPVVRTPRKDGFYQVYIRVMHNRKPGYIKTDKVITKQSLDREGDITIPSADRTEKIAISPEECREFFAAHCRKAR